MYNVSAPTFLEYIDDEYHHVSSIRLPAFAGMQITNGPYGSVSEPGAGVRFEGLRVIRVSISIGHEKPNFYPVSH